jgi:Ca-activated chloride channel family protein
MVGICEVELMRFTDPVYLLLLVPLAAGLTWSLARVHGMARARKRLAFGIRFMLGCLLVLALAGPQAHRPNEGICTIFLLDQSDSIIDADRRDAQQFVDKALQSLGPHDLGGVVTFGKDAMIDASPAGRRPLGSVLTRLDGTASDLAQAIRLASATFPEGKGRRIVMLSDGNETNGDAMEAAQVASTDGIQIDHVPLGLRDRTGEASVVSVDSPAEMRVDQPFDCRVIVDSTRDQRAIIDVDRDGLKFKKLDVSLTAGRNSIVFTDKLPDAGFHKYRATLRAQDDPDDRNNVGMSFVSVKGKPKLLILQQDPSKSELAAALRKSGIDAEVGGPANIPSRPEDLQAYDAVILNDINCASFTESQQQVLQSGVRDSGIGFAMIGGENSFLPGGYYGSRIAEVLPVDLNVRQRKTFPSTSICIICDASGSMGATEDGIEKIRLAAKAAEETVKLMSPMDRVGVAGSTDGIEFVAPMQKLTNKAEVIAQIQKLSTGGGGIYINPSMAKGEDVLNKENSKVRHLILLADGADSDYQEGSIAIALRMKANKITTTVVAIGDGKDVPFLKTLAAAGGGRFYLASKASQLPAIFTQDASVMSRSAIEEGAFYPRMNPSEEILRGISDSGVPPLLAYCLADSRPLATIGMKSPKDDPVLAKWQYGLATSLAFMSDAKSRWAAKWVPWEGFGTFWSQAARGISRRSTLNNYQVALKGEGGKSRVEVTALDRLGNPMNSIDASVRVASPSGDFKELPLSQTGPGVFSAAFESSQIGTYIVTVAEPNSGNGARTQAIGLSNPYPAEYRSYRANRPLLKNISSITGGKQLATPADATRPVANPGESISELWPLMMLLAALLLPIDIGIRRIALPIGEILAKMLAAAKRRRREAPIPAQQATVARLKQAKVRAATDTSNQAESPKIVTTPQERRPNPTVSKGSTATSLLEAKRKREKR